MSLKSGYHPARFAMCRGWYRQFFRDHYGSASGDSEAVFGIGRTRDKIKVWCVECYHHRLLGVMNLTPELLRQCEHSLDISDSPWLTSHHSVVEP